MSRIIKNVPPEIITTVEEIVRCPECLCGTVATRDGVKTNSFEIAMEDVGKPCRRCGKARELVTDEYSNTQPGYTLVECDCGNEIECHHFTNTCSICDTDYNNFGQQLAPRELWEEDMDDDDDY